MSWANSIGIKGVKVDYYESDNQSTMNQMYLCAKIAAEDADRSGADNGVTYTITVDEANRIRTKALNSGDWVTVKKETLYLELADGENTIKFYNDETEDELVIVEGAGYEYSLYEAENGKVVNGATIEGNYDGWLGGGSSVTLEDRKVDESGKYYLMIQYMSGEDRNVIKLSNASGYAPNIDSIGIFKTMIIDERATDEEGVNETKDDVANDNDSFMYVIIGVLAVIVLSVIAILIIKKRRKI